MNSADDHGWTDYGFMGHKEVKTPNLDRLAKQGLVFQRGYVPSSLCCPSLASIITGLYPHQHRITSNDPPRPPNLKPGLFYKSEAFHEKVAKARRSYDPAERRALYADAERIAFEDVPLVPLVAMPRTAATSTRVGGFVLDPISSPRFAWASLGE